MKQVENILLKLNNLSEAQVSELDMLMAGLSDEEKETALHELRYAITNREQIPLKESLSTYEKRAEIDIRVFASKFFIIVSTLVPLLLVLSGVVIYLVTVDDLSSVFKGFGGFLSVLFGID